MSRDTTYVRTRNINNRRVRLFLKSIWDANKNKPSHNIFEEIGDDELPTAVPTEKIATEFKGLKEITFKKTEDVPPAEKEEKKEIAEPVKEEAPKANLSMDMTANPAIEIIKGLKTKEQIEAFIAGETRTGIKKAAQEAIAKL